VSPARRDGEASTQQLVSKDVTFGSITAHPDGIVDLSAIEGVDNDLVIRPFGQKGVMTSLRQFTLNAANPPLVRDDLSSDWAEAAARGDAHFEAFGCSSCHRKALPLESLTFHDPGPFDSAGTLNASSVAEPARYDLAMLDWAERLPKDEDGRVLVPLFGDLKRHEISDQEIDRLGNELLSQRFVDRTVFMTAELWGLGDTGPYGHRNDITTLDEVILAHGGAAREARDLYADAPSDIRSDIIAYLRSLAVEK